MKIIKIPYSIQDSNAAPTRAAIRLSAWLKENYDLVRDRDYDWLNRSELKEFHFRFYGERTKDFDDMETFIQLAWVQEFVK